MDHIRDVEHDSIYEKYGYSYGDGPVPVVDESQKLLTPAPKKTREKSKRDVDKKDKKRKRHHVDDLDLSGTRQRHEDEMMTDAPPVLHSGLTGGLNRLLARPDFPPSPDFSGNDGGEPSPGSPLKRSKRGSVRSSSRVMSLNGNTDTRKSSSSTNDERPRKHHRKHRKHRDGSERPSIKAIEYPMDSGNDSKNQLVIYQSRAELFCSFINKGPESEKGYSLNKALKRYHRERVDKGIGLGKAEEEKALWKSLRLRRNINGEIVLFI
jgi:cell growth-regulating nucleolar protein